jgi:hypothetical protein
LEEVCMTILNDDNNDDDAEDDPVNNNPMLDENVLKIVENKVRNMNLTKNSDLNLILRTVSKYKCAALKAADQKVQNGGMNIVPTKVDQRLIFTGEIFPEGRKAFSNFKEELEVLLISYHTSVNMTAINFVTRPRPLDVFSSLDCSGCRKPFQVTETTCFYGCLVCDDPTKAFCADCRLKHDSAHPLVVLGIKHHDLKRTLFGIGHVKIATEDEDFDEEHDGPHPDVGCDACLRSVTADLMNPRTLSFRYKNLARQEHELCSKCFVESLKDANMSEQQFYTKYQCHFKDPFCEMKSSIGVSFSRRDSFFPSGVVEKNPLGQEGGATKLIIACPPGHTEFSWRSPSELRSAGHTKFSWGS